MALTLDEVRKIARLARLRLSPEEEGLFAAQLGEIVDYFDQLQRYEATPAPAWEAGAPEAEDRPEPCLAREAVLARAPETQGPFLVVPAVMGDGDA